MAVNQARTRSPPWTSLNLRHGEERLLHDILDARMPGRKDRRHHHAHGTLGLLDYKAIGLPVALPDALDRGEQ